ncbi:MFS transporter [Corynebacterium mastitidis]|uniref:MFS transporter n=1 Tax=Corynebacterium mastitidis TaxID=161890 RepID=A0ABU8NZI2_9CORY
MPRRPLFIGGHTLFGLASLLCALAPSSDWLIAGRVIQALGATLVFATCMPILADTHEGDERGRARAVGAFTPAGAAAAALGPLVGGVLVGGGGWRWIFVVNLPVSAVAIAAMLAAGRGAPEPQRRSGSSD